ncbi:hypothetical protein GCM10017674_61010 [Streptomyces gardneri]|uniref:Uncharacterized protein n=1 Tax=Streptomyces gardneri TaxID=66892 RepID=A0A4Y3RKI7_9ACTN|nr:hypothetical protein SGA01_28220 [Streptomyces gardneri]GHH13549.1 hypothetical protein GCM10017674_61010 [Streptomyces gardneri]
MANARELEDSSGPFTLDGSGAMPLEAGDPRQIGAFRLLGVLGSGGMGRAYLGWALWAAGFSGERRPVARRATGRELPRLTARIRRGRPRQEQGHQAGEPGVNSRATWAKSGSSALFLCSHVTATPTSGAFPLRLQSP